MCVRVCVCVCVCVCARWIPVAAAFDVVEKVAVGEGRGWGVVGSRFLLSRQRRANYQQVGFSKA